MRRLFFVGAGSFARELASWLKLDRPEWSGFRHAGFLTDMGGSVADFPVYQPGITGGISDFQPLEGDGFVMAISDPRGKLKVAQTLMDRGAQFLTFVHPSALVADHVRIGRGVVICPNSVVSCHAELGDFSAINIACTVGHDAKIGRGCTLSAHVDITGFAVLGEGAFLGSHASVLPRARVGAYAKVGAGSVVLRRVRDGATVMGVPARQIFP
jgi:sugar O-acyltransferase (sialic acid O-acetyltransferase NeuD family)